jgi:hypothetical protein
MDLGTISLTVPKVSISPALSKLMTPSFRTSTCFDDLGFKSPDGGFVGIDRGAGISTLSPPDEMEFY